MSNLNQIVPNIFNLCKTFFIINKKGGGSVLYFFSKQECMYVMNSLDFRPLIQANVFGKRGAEPITHVVNILLSTLATFLAISVQKVYIS